MKTDDVIAMLATNVAPVPRQAALRNVLVALAAGLVLSVLWMLSEYGVRKDIAQAVDLPMFWVKLAFPACVAVAGFVLVYRLSRPGVAARKAWLGVGLPVAALWLMAVWVLVQAPAAERTTLILGQTWATCALSIVTMALPVFVATFVALKRLAPTQPANAGAAAGVLAAGTGAAVYALHCPELAAPFLAIWYVLGMAVLPLVGACIGPRLLRW
jgi:hypothetical protein